MSELLIEFMFDFNDPWYFVKSGSAFVINDGQLLDC